MRGRSEAASSVGADEDQAKYVEMLKKTIQINKNLLPLIQKRKLEKSIQMRIMKRVKDLKDELAEIESGGAEAEGSGNSGAQTP